MFGFLLGEALRDLRRAGRVAVSAILLITLSLAALGAFWLLSSNMSEAITQGAPSFASRWWNMIPSCSGASG